jgi:hypothetical protein
LFQRRHLARNISLQILNRLQLFRQERNLVVPVAEQCLSAARRNRVSVG